MGLAIEIRGEALDESLRPAATPGQLPGAGDRLAHGIGTGPERLSDRALPGAAHLPCANATGSP